VVYNPCVGGIRVEHCELDENTLVVEVATQDEKTVSKSVEDLSFICPAASVVCLAYKDFLVDGDQGVPLELNGKFVKRLVCPGTNGNCEHYHKNSRKKKFIWRWFLKI
jgi:hypothetical protein